MNTCTKIVGTCVVVGLCLMWMGVPCFADQYCFRHVYNDSYFTLRVESDEIHWLPNGEPVYKWCTGQAQYSGSKYCVDPTTSEKTISAGEEASGITVYSLLFPSSSIHFGSTSNGSCRHISHSGNTGPYISVNTGGDGDIGMCSGLCGLYGAGLSSGRNVLCITQPGRQTVAPTKGDDLYKIGESACIGRAISTREESFDIPLGVDRTFDRGVPTTWPTGPGFTAPVLLSMVGPSITGWQKTGDMKWEYQDRRDVQAPVHLTVTGVASPPQIHVQFSGRPSEGDTPGRTFTALPFAFIISVGPSNYDLRDKLGGAVYISITPSGENLSAPTYGPVFP